MLEQDIGKIPPGQTLLLSEPIFRAPKAHKEKYTIQVPKGAEEWAHMIAYSDLSPEFPEGAVKVEEILKDEYICIVSALMRHKVPFRMIVAHKDNVDPSVVLGLYNKFGIRGVEFDPSIQSTCFPRDWLVTFESQTFINPDANFYFPNIKNELSALGEGGNVIKPTKTGNPVFVVEPEGLPSTKRSAYGKSLNKIRANHSVGQLPPPHAIELNHKTRTTEEFISSHIDRVSALVQDEQRNNFLLVDSNYLAQSSPENSYHKLILSECQKLRVEMIEVPTSVDDVPYALNLEQFYDRTVFVTCGHKVLTKILGQIVGDDNVFTTEKPLILYPILRNGGLRCMMLFAPEYIAGRPKITQQNIYDSDPKTNLKETNIKVGRNEQCHCGSGIKFKHCHGK